MIMKLLLPFTVLVVLPFHFSDSQMEVCSEDTSNLTDSDLFILQLEKLDVNQTRFPDVNITSCEGVDQDDEEEISVFSNDDRGYCNPREDIQCMCGSELEASQRAYQRRLCSTCSNFGTIKDSSSLISFCRNSLSTPDYRGIRSKAITYCVRYSKVNESTDLSTVQAFTKNTLSETVERMEDSLRIFLNVLNRTIVGVYFRSKGQRCACLDAYKKWLCTTMLPLYEAETQTSVKEGKMKAQMNTKCDNTTVATLNGEVVVQRRPCLDVCYGVLQICPYYLPSRFQQDTSNVDEFKTVIYGGYPAFDCPREKTVQECEHGNSTCSYTLPECDCLRFSSATSVHLAPPYVLTIRLVVLLVCVAMVVFLL